MTNAGVLVLIAGILFSASTLVSDREARAENQVERAEERAEEAAERAEERTEDRVERAKERAEKQAEKKAEKRAKEREESAEGRAGGSESEGRGPEDVTVKVESERQAEFLGTCAVSGGEEDAIGGNTPQSFDYNLNGQRLECEIQNQSGGSLRVVLTSGDGDRSVYEIDGRGGTIKLAYTKNGISSSISSGGSGGRAGSSS